MRLVVLALVLAQCLTIWGVFWYKAENDEVIERMYSAMVHMLEWQDEQEAQPWFQHRNEETDL